MDPDIDRVSEYNEEDIESIDQFGGGEEKHEPDTNTNENSDDENDDEAEAEIDDGEDDEDEDDIDTDNDDITISSVMHVNDLPKSAPKRNTKANHYATKYEVVKALAVRASQLSRGAEPFVNVGDLINVSDIAEKELFERTIPIIIERPFPDGTVIHIKLSDMIIPPGF